MAKLETTLNKLKTREIDTLKAIYDYRCLTVSQIYKLHYRFSEKNGSVVSDSYCKTQVRAMKQMGVVKIEKYLEDDIVFITTHGINILRHYNKLPTSVYDEASRTVIQGYHTAKDLEIQIKFYNHQLNLNNFVIDFNIAHDELNYKYLDEKDISHYSAIRPDGLLSISDTDIFLEMDMSTESKKQLDEKWAGYREFLNSNEFEIRNKKIIMLFIIEGKIQDQDKNREDILKEISERKKIVKNRIHSELFDMIGENFDIYIGSQEEMLDLLNEKIVPEITKGNSNRELLLADSITKNHQFLYRTYEFSLNKKILNKGIPEFSFDSYIYKHINIDGKIDVLKDSMGRRIEFLIDDYTHEPVSIARKLYYVNRIHGDFRKTNDRVIRYIVLVDSIENIYDDLKVYNIIGDLKDVYFTTLDRLNELPFFEAIFFISPMGNVYHFKDDDLKETQIEANLRD